MKYIKINEQQGIILSVDEFSDTPKDSKYIKITDKQAEEIESSEIDLFYKDGIIFNRDKFLFYNLISKIGIVECKKYLIKKSARDRYEKEVGGFEYKGVTIQTDRDSRQALSVAYIRAKEDNTTVINWKTKSKFIELNSQDIIELHNLIFDYVESAFTHEKNIVESVINANTIVELINIKV